MPERSGLETSEIYAQMQALVSLVLHIPVADVQAVVDELSLIDAAMPLLDPTGYRRIMDTKPAHDRFARAFLRFRKEIDGLIESDQRIA
ncbi:MAG TPA: hypothetical protein PKK15_04745 [Kouleothrix sp.]|nr:hypothetical protein [Kouleothrix sp.]